MSTMITLRIPGALHLELESTGTFQGQVSREEQGADWREATELYTAWLASRNIRVGKGYYCNLVVSLKAARFLDEVYLSLLIDPFGPEDVEPSAKRAARQVRAQIHAQKHAAEVSRRLEEKS